MNLNSKDAVATTHPTTGNVTGGGSGYMQGGVPVMLVLLIKECKAEDSQKMCKRLSLMLRMLYILKFICRRIRQQLSFGNSLLESIFKVYKQKELLEDAIIIYRVQRAPERRVFYVDVGNMPSHLAMQFVERVKTDILQRRIISATGGGQNVIDSA